MTSRTTSLVTLVACAGYLAFVSQPTAAAARVVSAAERAEAPTSPTPQQYTRANFLENVAASLVAAAVWAAAEAVWNSVKDQQADEGSMDGLTGFQRGTYIPAGALDLRCDGCVALTGR